MEREEDVCLLPLVDRGIQWSGTNLPITSWKVGDFTVSKDARGNVQNFVIGQEYCPRLENEFDFEDVEKELNLDDGFDATNTNQPVHDDGINELLRFILWRAEKTNQKNLTRALDGAKVVCNRNFIKTLGTGENWNFVIEKFHGVFFVKKDYSDPVKNHRNSHRGSKFESILFSRKIDENMPANLDNFSSKSVFVTKFPSKNSEKLVVFYSAQIDGLDSKNQNLEAKSSNIPRKENWIQCKLGMTDTVICGKPDSKFGYVAGTEKLPADNLKIAEFDHENYIETFVSRMEQIIQQTEKMAENELLVIGPRLDNGISYNIIDKTENNQILNHTFKKYFKQ